MSFNASNYMAQGGAKWVIGGGLEVDGGDVPLGVSMVADSGGSNVCEVTITVNDAAGNIIPGVYNLDVWLSDATTGAGLTGTSASGTVTVKAGGGAVIGTYEAKKALRVQTLATGIFVLQITDTAKSLFKVCAAVPGTGRTVVGITLAAGDYG